MAQTNWQLDNAHSEISFKVRHLLVATVSGSFKDFSAEVRTEGDDFSTATIAFTVQTASIHTGVADRDGHLQSDDFFNSEAYPTLSFKSDSITLKGENTYTVEGELTIRDVTQRTNFTVEMGGIAVDPWGNTKAGFEVSGKIKRKEFGLKWDAVTEVGGAVVSDEVRIEANLQFIKTPA